jgi:hypothetical protein
LGRERVRLKGRWYQPARDEKEERESEARMIVQGDYRILGLAAEVLLGVSPEQSIPPGDARRANKINRKIAQQDSRKTFLRGGH